MKKIIISGKQLSEAVTLAPEKNTYSIETGVNDAAKNVIKNNLPQTVQNPNGGIKDKVLNVTPENGVVPMADLNKVGQQNPEKVNVIPQDDTSDTTMLECVYCKKQIEEARKMSNFNVMTKRQLQESWSRVEVNSVDDIFNILNQKKTGVQAQIQDYVETLEQIEVELKKAIEEITEALQRYGINITGTKVEYIGDEVYITIKTDWVLKGDDYDEDQEDYITYKYLSKVVGATYNYNNDYGLMRPADYHYVFFNLEDDKNPYFRINCDIPDINKFANEEEDY